MSYKEGGKRSCIGEYLITEKMLERACLKGVTKFDTKMALGTLTSDLRRCPSGLVSREVQK